MRRSGQPPKLPRGSIVLHKIHDKWWQEIAWASGDRSSILYHRHRPATKARSPFIPPASYDLITLPLNVKPAHLKKSFPSHSGIFRNWIGFIEITNGSSMHPPWSPLQNLNVPCFSFYLGLQSSFYSTDNLPTILFEVATITMHPDNLLTRDNAFKFNIPSIIFKSDCTTLHARR